MKLGEINLEEVKGLEMAEIKLAKMEGEVKLKDEGVVEMFEEEDGIEYLTRP